VDSFPMSAENMSGGQTPGHGSRGQEAEEGVDADRLAGRAEVGRRAEGVAADEDALVLPPERDFPPAGKSDDPAKRERRAPNAVEGDDMERDAEPLGELGAVTVVAVEKLDHSGGPAGMADSLLEALGSQRIDEPHGALHDQRVGRPLEEPRLDPTEPMLELVTGPVMHLRRHRIETRI
jgi:hypothetical protein